MQQTTWQYLSHRGWDNPIGIEPFAWSDVLLRQTDGGRDYLYLWEMDHTVILGMRDGRLPHAVAATQSLIAVGYRVVLRHFGGLAVVADEGVLNVTLVLDNTERQWSVQQAYDWVVNVLRGVLPEAGERLTTGEVATSYCPGDYDISIDGKKVAGIAQRRFKTAIAISLYISVGGDQHRRGVAVRQFYERAQLTAAEQPHFPNVDPASMATLNEMLGEQWSTTVIAERLQHYFSADPIAVVPTEMQEQYEQFLDKMLARQLTH